ncbi:MAG TPA: hypothetical protein PKK56_00760 [archaeon]|jgi:hypothetical protein|nr:hypothetical protein [archaeon]HPC10064.1 hypothetical protein [archaeon]HRT03068.1 hypothetical protein [Candidatus Diapherotrites archaeon]
MGIITISMDKESENILRSTAKMMYGSRKDALSKTIVHSITKLRNERNEAVQNFMELTSKEKCAKVGKGSKIPKARVEYYER